MFFKPMLAVLAACAVLVSPAVAEKVVLGKLGQVTEAAKIYSKPTSHSRLYAKINAFEYIVVRRVNDDWFKVLLQNGRYGYVDADCVAQLPYEVSQGSTKGRAGSTASRRFSRGTAGASGSAAAANYALNFVGTPYEWGGNDPRTGIDCSGLVQQMFGAFGQNLPRTAAEQALVGTPIRRLEDLRKGDRLYFWEAKRGKIGHTGIYLGNGYFVHSSVSHHGVATDYLGSPKWLHLLVAARRS